MRTKKLRISRKLVHNITELKRNRDIVHGLTTSFLNNVSHRIMLVDYVFKTYQSSHKKSKDPVILLSICLFISSLVSCWETFFRDMINFVIEEDKEAYIRAIRFIEKTSKSTFQSNELEPHGISLGDYYCKHFNLQNINNLRDSLNIIFDKSFTSVFEYLQKSFRYQIYFTEENYFMYWMQDADRFTSTLNIIALEAFDVRHNFVHDANFKFTFDHNKIAQYEYLLIIFPQLISVWLANKYSQKRLVFNVDQQYIRYTNNPTEKEGSYVVSPTEIRAKDWKVVE